MFNIPCIHKDTTIYHKIEKEGYKVGITVKETERNWITTAYGFKEKIICQIIYRFIKQCNIFLSYIHLSSIFCKQYACDDPTVNVIGKKESEMGRLDYGCIASRLRKGNCM